MRAARVQRSLISSAGDLVRPGGVLVYSTCTFAPEENEQIIAEFLQNPGWQLLEARIHPTFDNGVPAWANGNPALVQSARLWPHKLRGEGHFLARLRKTQGEEGHPSPERISLISHEVQAIWQDWAQEHLKTLPQGEVLVRTGHLYLVPPGLPSLGGIRALAPGLYLGQVRTGGHKKAGRFLPGKPLAHYLKPTQVVHTLAITSDDPRAMRFANNEPVPADGVDGWLLVALQTEVGSFSLGWGRLKSGILRAGKTGL